MLIMKHIWGGVSFLPNVSICDDDAADTVHYNPIVEPTIPSNEIWYTTTTNETINPSDYYEGVTMVSNTYDGHKCVMRFEENITDITELFDNDGREEDETQLLTVRLPEVVENIGDYAFFGCRRLTSVTIPISVTNIGTEAFENCSGLTSVNIPNSVTSIGDSAFDGCSNLTTMTVEATTPPTLANTNAISTATTTIYVPSESVNAYKTASNWSSFASIIQPIP